MTTTAPAPSARLYRVSALGSALVRMWRTWRVLVPVVIVNAAVQALLVLPGTLPYLTWSFALLALIGFAAMVVSYGLVAAAMLQAVDGPVAWGPVLRAVRDCWRGLTLWSVVLLLAVTIGLALYVVPGILVLALTPYVLLAVVDGRSGPWRTNLRTIRRRWGRWIVTVVAMIAVSAVLWLLAALDGFFVTGAPAALLGWLVLGLVAGWFLCAWALVYRSVPVDA